MTRVIWESVQPVQFVYDVVQVEHGAVHYKQEVVPQMYPELQVQVPVFNVIFDGEHDKQYEAEEQLPQGDVQAVHT